MDHAATILIKVTGIAWLYGAIERVFRDDGNVGSEVKADASARPLPA